MVNDIDIPFFAFLIGPLYSRQTIFVRVLVHLFPYQRFVHLFGNIDWFNWNDHQVTRCDWHTHFGLIWWGLRRKTVKPINELLSLAFSTIVAIDNTSRPSFSWLSCSKSSTAAARRDISGIISSRIFNSLVVKIQSKDFLMPIITTNISGNNMDV